MVGGRGRGRVGTASPFENPGLQSRGELYMEKSREISGLSNASLAHKERGGPKGPPSAPISKRRELKDLFNKRLHQPTSRTGALGGPHDPVSRPPHARRVAVGRCPSRPRDRRKTEACTDSRNRSGAAAPTHDRPRLVGRQRRDHIHADLRRQGHCHTSPRVLQRLVPPQLQAHADQWPQDAAQAFGDA